MKLGLQLYHFKWKGVPENTGQTIIEIARAAEDAGFSSLWVMDHFFQLGGAFGPADDDAVGNPVNLVVAHQDMGGVLEVDTVAVLPLTKEANLESLDPDPVVLVHDESSVESRHVPRMPRRRRQAPHKER